MVGRLRLVLSLTALAGAIVIPPAAAQRPAGDAASFAAYASTGYRITANVTYLTASGMDLKLDFYRPARAAGPLPTVLFFHGGGYRLGAKKETSAFNVLPYVQMGWNAVNVEYRPTEIALAPAAVTDARCALRWVIQNAKEYNVDVNRIVVTGQSAGGHLSLMTGLLPETAGFDRSCPGTQPLKVAAVVNWYGVADYGPLADDPARTYAITWIGPQQNRKELAAMISPLTYMRRGLPPVITIHGDADPVVPYDQATRLLEALKAAGVAAELVTIPGGGHGGFERDQVLRAWTAIETFLTKHVLTRSAAPTSSQ